MADASVLQAYPNPSHGAFQVRLASLIEGPAQVELFDLQRRRVRTVFDGLLATGSLREVGVAGGELAPGCINCACAGARTSSGSG